ncbi:MAG: UDP-N-acetylglucosamine 2-epimerase, partial [archaeon]|nr:UDP-N-acetylglucosamine 2-epimerase [archaeon]
MKIGVLVGTRPELIKMSPVIRELQKRKIDFSLIHTGQHYSFEMDMVFFEELGLPKPHMHLNAKNMEYHAQMSAIISGTQKFIRKEKIRCLLVQGDTNSVLGGAIAAKNLGILLGHVESGLRSYDQRMQEEFNRYVTDHLSDFLFAPTNESRDILIGEGIPNGKIFVTGNTVVDAVKHNIRLAKPSAAKGDYFL